MLTAKDKTFLVEKIIKILELHEIDIEVTTLDHEQYLLLLSEIIACIESGVDLVQYIKDVESGEKPSVIMEIIIEVLASPTLNELVSDELRGQISEFSKNVETMNMVAKCVNFVNKKIIESYDENGDGIVTISEIETDVVNCCLGKKNDDSAPLACYAEGECCACCMDFSKFIAKLWANFYMKYLCCADHIDLDEDSST
tara:strand:+ start:121 stop:717 length:597 start_codon:yes stop_codon:yes gene_type:complete